MKTLQNSSVCAAVALTFSILAACSGGATTLPTGGGPLLASSYDQSCSVASDCAPIYAGTATCCNVACDNAAINRSDLSKYEADLAADTPTDCTRVACPAIACEVPDVACVAGTCAIAQGGPDSGTGSGKTDAGSGSCTSDTDCEKGFVCGFSESDGCSAQGKCFQEAQVVCDAYSPGCACDGTTLSIVCTGLPSGYVSKPLAYKGLCSDAGGEIEAGEEGDACPSKNICLSTLTCLTDKDCPGSECDPCTKLCGCGVEADGGK
jgi:hypothetical protein